MMTRSPRTGRSKLTKSAERFAKEMDSRDLYELLSMIAIHVETYPNAAKDASEAAAYIAWRINRRLPDLSEPYGGERCQAATFAGVES